MGESSIGPYWHVRLWPSARCLQLLLPMVLRAFYTLLWRQEQDNSSSLFGAFEEIR